MVPDIKIIDLTPDNIADYGVCGYMDVGKHPELRRKIEWFSKYYPKGLRIKALLSASGGYQGMLEYIPGEYAHRPVIANGYMFIHCIFVGFKKEFKGKGYASLLIEACINDAKTADMKGVAVVTRNGSFMAKPDFELLVLKFDPESEDPRFGEMSLNDYSEGLTVLRSPQCPYSVKNVDAIIQTAKK
jgi:GNAT superfamily N-acetyltransferase